MNVERDIVGVAAPFAVGVLLTVYAGASFPAAFVMIAVAFSLLCFSLYPNNASCWTDSRVIWILIYIATCGCGILSAATGQSLIDMPESWLERIATDFCRNMQASIDKIPFQSEDTNALLKAVLTGEKASLSNEIKHAFRSSGASHILALSGLHLGIIYMIISKALGILGNDVRAKLLRSILIILLCGFYTLATGAGASITRAFIFITLGEIARMTGRNSSLVQTLFTSLLLQLVFSPLSMKTIGFQLSYAAMAGIAFIFPWLKSFWPEGKEKEPSTKAGRILSNSMGWIWNSAALSISCQITTGPIAYLYFGSVPLNFILTNLIALPLTGILIPFALAALCMSSFGWCPEFIIGATEQIARILIWSLQVIAS